MNEQPLYIIIHIIVTQSWKMVPNHTFLFQNIYYCSMNFQYYFIEFNAQIIKIVQ